MGRKRYKLRIVGKAKRLSDEFHIGLDLGSFKLVSLVGDHRKLFSRRLEVFCHRYIVLRGLVSGVDNKYPYIVGIVPGKEALHKFSPSLLLGGGDFGVAIAGEIYEIHSVVYQKIIDMYSLTRLGACLGQILSV